MRLGITGLCLLICAGVGRAQSAPAGPSEADKLAAESLWFSAVSVVHSHPDTPARTWRVVAHTQYADRLDPGNPRIERMLADAYETQGRFQEASAAVAKYLRSAPGDYVHHLRRIRLLVNALQTAGEREELLKELVEREDLPAAVRAEAAVLTGRILRGKGETEEARLAYETALKHDPYHPDALTAALAFKKDPTAADRVKVLLTVLRSNPGHVETAQQVGTQLGAMGLYDPALRFLDHAMAVARFRRADVTRVFALAGEHANALLDAGKVDQAIPELEKHLRRFRGNTDLQSLLVEAYLAAGQDEKASGIVQDMEAALKPKQSAAAVSETFAKKLAWFYLVTLPKATTALGYARQAEKMDASDPAAQRILGVAELKTGDTNSGLARLQKLAGKDTYAAAFLADYYFGAGLPAEGKKAIQAAAPLPRDGPAFRRLRALVARYNVELPAAEGAAEARQAAEAFPDAPLELASAPEKFLEVSIRPTAERMGVGEPVEVEAVLVNKSSIDIPIGMWGLFSPVMALHLEASTDRDRKKFASLPVANWPAPRYLKSGERVTCRVRLDVGDLGRFLANRPLEEITLKVQGMLDPVQYGTEFVSFVPSVRPVPAQIVLADLLGDFDRTKADEWPKRYQLALGRIVYDMKRGDLRARMLAARRVGSLLGLARLIEQGRALPPRHLDGKVTRGVLLRMMVEILKDKSDVVRAEMLSALNHVDLDAGIIRWFGSTIEDPSALVRFRLVELLGASGVRGQETVVDYLAQDPDEMVRQMAKGFRTRASTRKQPSPARPRSGSGQE
ncbi:MAG TPA: tetratricopeptide repeat protein [Phycisphaerae bacterium]|nr:tetratricopeptide repeat protein [Phycisphaerae bacterium]